jgi:hypothetical protein
VLFENKAGGRNTEIKRSMIVKHEVMLMYALFQEKSVALAKI